MRPGVCTRTTHTLVFLNGTFQTSRRFYRNFYDVERGNVNGGFLCKFGKLKVRICKIMAYEGCSIVNWCTNGVHEWDWVYESCLYPRVVPLGINNRSCTQSHSWTPNSVCSLYIVCSMWYLVKNLQNWSLYPHKCLFIFLLLENEQWEMREFIFYCIFDTQNQQIEKKWISPHSVFLHVSHCGPLPSPAWCWQIALHITLDTPKWDPIFQIHVLCFRSKCLTEVKGKFILIHRTWKSKEKNESCELHLEIFQKLCWKFQNGHTTGVIQCWCLL